MDGGERYKQIILIRRDLKMRRGKEIAQGSHASMLFIASRLRQSSSDAGVVQLTPIERQWLAQGMAKICVKVTSEQELLERHQRALAAGISSYLVRDSGRTEFNGVPTHTACAIGPDTAERLDAITGDLALY